jgi:hypothetical protein
MASYMPRQPATAESDQPSVRASQPPLLTGRVESDVWVALQQLLLNGSLAAYSKTSDQEVKQFPAEFWDDRSSVQLVRSQRIEGDRLVYEVSLKVLLSQVQVKALLEAARSAARQTRNVDRGGAPPKYDIEAFLTEAFRILYESNPGPKTPAELRRRTLDAYAEKGHAGGVPSEDWARPKISKLWKRLRGD